MSARREITKKYARAGRVEKGRLLDALVVLQEVWRLCGQPSEKYLAAIMDDPLTVPGFLELDTVAHCGHTLKDEFLRTLTGTDPVSGWTMLRTIRNDAYVHVHGGLEWMVGHAPVPVAGVDFDNGSEFMNWGVIAWADKKKIPVTRGRLLSPLTKSRAA